MNLHLWAEAHVVALLWTASGYAVAGALLAAWNLRQTERTLYAIWTLQANGKLTFATRMHLVSDLCQCTTQVCVIAVALSAATWVHPGAGTSPDLRDVYQTLGLRALMLLSVTTVTLIYSVIHWYTGWRLGRMVPGAADNTPPSEFSS